MVVTDGCSAAAAHSKANTITTVTRIIANCWYQFFIAVGRKKQSKSHRVKYWKIVVKNLKQAGFSVGWVSALDDCRRTVWIVDAHRDGRRFVVRADEKLTAFVELER